MKSLSFSCKFSNQSMYQVFKTGSADFTKNRTTKQIFVKNLKITK